MTTTSTIESRPLEVHVLGAGKGESIVLKLPDDQWGVVDCYASSTTDPSTNPTIEFLRGRGVKQLQFLCLTHPHDDHFFGMSTLIDEFKPREFWRASCLSPDHVKLLAKYYRIAGIANGADSLTKSAKELATVYSKVRAAVKNDGVEVIRAQSRMTLYPSPASQTGTFRIECIAPSGTQVELYEGAVWDCVGPNGQTGEPLSRSQHNNISLVLKIVYGEYSVLLCGDLEEEGWKQVLKEYKGEQLSACAVKVGHHGSPNGYCDDLWSHFASKGKPYAVVAPSRSHKLPKPKALQHIKDFAKEIYATCHFDGEGVATPTPASKGPIDSRLAIRDAFGATPKVAVSSTYGWCSLTLDAKGQCNLVANPPAHQVQIAPS